MAINNTDGRKKNGGPRKGAGRKAQFDEPTATLTFRLPISLINVIKKAENANQRAYNALKNEFDGVQEQHGTHAKDGG